MAKKQLTTFERTLVLIGERLKTYEPGDVVLAALAAFTGSLLSTQDWGKAALVAAVYAAARAVVSKVYDFASNR